MKKAKSRVGFAFSSKERMELSLRSLASIDTDAGFDLIWADGSNSAEGKALPSSVKLRNCNLVETHLDVRGGPDAAIRFSLNRLLALGYDYCGLIENDIEFQRGWFANLMDLFAKGQRDGIKVGAVTARTLETRILGQTPDYAVVWSAGAGMVLFTRLAAKIVLARYRNRTAKEVSAFYANAFNSDLKNVWELWTDKPDRWVGCDWGFDLELYRHGLATLGLVPCQAFNVDCDLEASVRTKYLRRPDEFKQIFPRTLLSKLIKMQHMRLTDRLRVKKFQLQDWYSRTKVALS
jgi:hypothetical protein